MKRQLDNDLNKAYEMFNQNHDYLRESLMASVPDRPPEKKIDIRQFIGETIMKSRITKLAAAAVIIIAVILGLNITGGPDKANVAWAEVVRPILNARTAIMDIKIGPEENQLLLHDEIMGSRIRRTVPNIQGTDIIIDLEEMKVITLSHVEKTAAYIEMDGLGNIQNYLKLLQDIVKKMQNKAKYQVENLGLQEIEGQYYIVFVAESDNDTINIWADPETTLPTRIEQKTPNMQIICDNLQFDVDLDESRFSLEVPDDYTILNAGIDFGKNNESEFIETLRIWAEIIEDGQFPDSINIENAVSIGLKFDKKLKQANLTEQQQLQIAMQFGQGLVFIRFFKGQGQWYYAGKSVKLGDSNTPIFWYQPQDSETWRIIYGDLRIEDASPENLPK